MFYLAKDFSKETSLIWFLILLVLLAMFHHDLGLNLANNPRTTFTRLHVDAFFQKVILFFCFFSILTLVFFNQKSARVCLGGVCIGLSLASIVYIDAGIASLFMVIGGWLCRENLG